MPEPTQALEELFACRHFAQALDGFQPPVEPFDPAAAWVNAYELVDRSGRTNRIGAVRLERQPLGTDRARLAVACRKGSSGGAVHLRAEIECCVDALATPLRARQETWAADRQGAAVDDSRLAEDVEFVADGLVLRRDGRERRLPGTAPFALDWGLFEAVQRLPRGPAVEQRFTFVGRVNWEVRPDHVLYAGPHATVSLGGRSVWTERAEPLEAGTVFRPVAAREGAVSVPLWAYEQLGTGLLPTTYWVNEHGRLLFVFSGLLAWVFNPKAVV